MDISGTNNSIVMLEWLAKNIKEEIEMRDKRIAELEFKIELLTKKKAVR